MASLQITDELNVQLTQAAERLGCSKDALVAEALRSRAEFVEAPLTEAELERMRQSIAQLDRGEYVTSKQVDEFFHDWFKEIETR